MDMDRDPLADGIAQAEDASRKARILRVGTDLMKVYMEDAAPRMNITMQTAVIACEGHLEDSASLLISTALAICSNTIGCMMEILGGLHPQLPEALTRALPSTLAALDEGNPPGTVIVMDGNGKRRDTPLAAELQEMFAERYAPRAR